MNRNVTCPFDKPYGSLKVSRCKPPHYQLTKFLIKGVNPPSRLKYGTVRQNVDMWIIFVKREL